MPSPDRRPVAGLFGSWNTIYKKFRTEPPGHAIGPSRSDLTTKNHLVCDVEGRALAFLLTPGQATDTSMLIDTLSEIRVVGRAGRQGGRGARGQGLALSAGSRGAAPRNWAASARPLVRGSGRSVLVSCPTQLRCPAVEVWRPGWV